MTDGLMREIISTLERLAMPGPDQLAYLDQIGVGVDELALEFDDVAPARTKLVSDGRMSVAQSEAIAAVNEQLERMTAAGASRWTRDAVLTGADWQDTRRRARLALDALR